jgi:hypothetical protein
LFVICRFSDRAFAQQTLKEQQIIQLSKKKFDWYQNYLRDSFLLKNSSIKDKYLEFSK